MTERSTSLLLLSVMLALIHPILRHENDDVTALQVATKETNPLQSIWTPKANTGAPSAINSHRAPYRYTYLLDLALTHSQPLLMVGPTGTGKSVYITRHLLAGLPKETWTPVFVTLSAATSANITQEQVRCCSLLHQGSQPWGGVFYNRKEASSAFFFSWLILTFKLSSSLTA